MAKLTKLTALRAFMELDGGTPLKMDELKSCAKADRDEMGELALAWFHENPDRVPEGKEL
jgi:hypothetical protein